MLEVEISGYKSRFRNLTHNFVLKAGFHMIADDRGSQKVLRSSAIIWKHTSAIACDPAIVIADDRLRSSAIVCDPAIIWKPKFCDPRSKNIQ